MICLQIIVLLLLLYLMFAVIPAFVSASVLFRPKRCAVNESLDLKGTYYEKYMPSIRSAADFFDDIQCRRISIPGYDGTVLNCDLYERREADTLVIFFHGYRSGPKMNFSFQARDLYQNGCSIAFAYERAHNGLEGKNIGLGAIEKHDVKNWCTYFRKNGKEKRAFVYGMSMGSTSVGLASDSLPTDYVSGLVLDSGYQSVYGQIKKECVKRHLPAKLLMPYIVLAAKLILREDIRDTVSFHLNNCSFPILFIHGKDDSTADFEKTADLYEKYSGKKTLLLTENAEHTVSYIEGKERAKNALLTFISENSEEVL